MKKFTIKLIVLLAVSIVAGHTYAGNCDVTSGSGTSSGSLPYAAQNCSGTITFSGVDTVNLTSPLYIDWNDGVVIDGGNSKVTITSSVSEGSAIVLDANDISLKNLIIESSSDICVEIMGSGNNLEKTAFKSCEKGIQISRRKNNTASELEFEGVSTPITLIRGGNNEIYRPSDLDAEANLDGTTWKLTGLVDNEVDSIKHVELYKVENDKISFFKKYTTSNGLQFSGESFSISLNISDASPDDTYRIIYTDSNDNTSPFSVEIIPINEGSFYNDDYDGDTNPGGSGVAGGGDVNPDDLDAEADEDGDGILNGEDNCPLDPNVDQENGDGDDYGDVCDVCLEYQNNEQTDTVRELCEDIDEDSVPDFDDNCIGIFDPSNSTPQCINNSLLGGVSANRAKGDGCSMMPGGTMNVFSYLSILASILMINIRRRK